MGPHSQIRFAKLTELSEPTFMPPNVYRSNVLPHSQVRFAQRTELSEPTFMPPQRISFQRAAALSSSVRKANRTFRANVYAAKHISFQRAAALSSSVREANQTFRANVYASPTYIVPTCCCTLKFGSSSKPNFLSLRLCRPNVYRSNVLPHSQVWFAKRTKLSEPTFMPPQRISFQRAVALPRTELS